ncbi:MAG: S26 family signal peptidase [Planctomycetota bacterium]
MDDTTPRRRRILTLLWRASVVALFLLLILKWGVVDGFEVRGNSMLPLLRDREGEPDKIVVFKRYFDLFAPERFGLVVFDRPEREAGSSFPANLQGDRFVKRLVAFPGEKVLVRDGDLFVIAKDGSGSLDQPVKRPLAVLLEMMQTVSRLDPGHPSGTPWSLPKGCHREGEWLVVDGSNGEAGLIRYGELIRDDWVDEAGRLQLGGSRVNDVAVSFRVVPEEGVRLVAELREAGDHFTAVLACGEPFRIFRRRGPSDAEELGAAGTGLAPGKEAQVVFLNVDNRLILLVDGVQVLDLPYEWNTEVVGLASNVPALGVSGGVARLREIEILRDIHYTENDCRFGVREPFEVPEGEYFLLGDNSVNSRDSRHFGSIPKERFVGRPFLILHPFHRFRAL